MGNFFSTRWGSHAPQRTLGEAVAFEARALARTAQLPVVVGTWELFARGEAPVWPVQDRVTLEAVAQPFGGVRWWCRCKRCDTRRRALYAVPRRSEVRCRRCWGLVYHSQRLALHDRLTCRARMLANRLGTVDAGLMFTTGSGWVPNKPTGMHWRTYRARALELRVVLARREDVFLAQAARYLDRVSPEWRTRTR
jgi:hypothetical protein